MINMQHITKAFDGTCVLTDLNLCVQKGSIYGLIGVNGAGKTTIINLLSGIYRPDAGDVQIEGQKVYDNPEIKARIGLIPDTLWFAAGSNLTTMSKQYRRLYPNWDQEKFEALVSVLKLDTKKSLRSFSKGMKKQAAFALVLSTQPDYLLLDEPMDGLDPMVRKIIWQKVLEETADRQMTVLISSHNLKELEGFCDAIGILSGGKMLLEKDLDEMKSTLYKVQVAFAEAELPESLKSSLQIIHRENHGTMHLLILKDPLSKIREMISAENPKLFDILPLTLEEIFIYELGGEHDEIQEVIL